MNILRAALIATLFSSEVVAPRRQRPVTPEPVPVKPEPPRKLPPHDSDKLRKAIERRERRKARNRAIMERK